jgi:hypothetical protein
VSQGPKSVLKRFVLPKVAARPLQQHPAVHHPNVSNCTADQIALNSSSEQ